MLFERELRTVHALNFCSCFALSGGRTQKIRPIYPNLSNVSALKTSGRRNGRRSRSKNGINGL